ncbi:MAG: hypothetical protein OEZ04_13705 [Nitrospinota bacterium]|nr:hypothetical protein [Nitrospinota bacterium]
MAHSYPEWATDKQKEGMAEFLAVAEAYGAFVVSFDRPRSSWMGPDSFTAAVKYGNPERSHEFDIAFDYQDTWDCCGNLVPPHWQFLFSAGDCAREISIEVFFVDLFSTEERQLDQALAAARSLAEG